MKVKTVLICKILILLETIAIVAGLIYYFVCIKDRPTYSPELVTYLLNNGSKNLDVDYDKYDLFVSGEWHATQKNFDVQMSIIKNLSENSDLKYIIAEDSMGNAMCINNYLHTGDISKLDVVFESLKGTFAGNNESYEFYKKLYEFNKNLPENKKITYLGMDIEHQTNISVGCLWDIALRNSISEKLEKFVQDINKKMVKKNPTYVNAGMLIFNLAEIRKDGIEDKFLKWTKEHFAEIKTGDQTIINEVCKEKIKLVNPIWNVQSFRLRHTGGSVESGIRPVIEISKDKL